MDWLGNVLLPFDAFGSLGFAGRQIQTGLSAFSSIWSALYNTVQHPAEYQGMT